MFSSSWRILTQGILSGAVIFFLHICLCVLESTLSPANLFNPSPWEGKMTRMHSFNSFIQQLLIKQLPNTELIVAGKTNSKRIPDYLPLTFT